MNVIEAKNGYIVTVEGVKTVHYSLVDMVTYFIENSQQKKCGVCAVREADEWLEEINEEKRNLLVAKGYDLVEATTADSSKKRYFISGNNTSNLVKDVIEIMEGQE